MKIRFFDGGMGTMLQQKGLGAGELPETWNLSHPEKVLEIHNAYAKAGSEFITSNTFGANRLKFDNADEIVRAGVEIASKAGKKVALDLGPTGKLLKPMGELDFEDAVSIYAQAVNAGKSKADAIIIETVSDTYEMKAAITAAKENSDLPVFASFIFGSDGRLLTGADIATAVTLCEGLRADVIGINCGFGPEQFISLIAEMRKYTSLPLIAQPNAGLPESIDNKAVYNITPEKYSEYMKEIASLGVSYLGGCCGTTPEYIKKTIAACSGEYITLPDKKAQSLVCSYSKTVKIGGEPVIIGERINPTGKKRLKKALIENDLNYIIKEGKSQQAAGADILDVNTGLPEIDEKEMLPNAVTALQSVLDTPLQIDTADAEALGKALRLYNGKALINSVNGKKKSMDTVFPLAAKYGAVTVCLLLDENGIPESADGRIAVARKIISAAESFGIDKKDLVFDALTMTVSTDKRNAAVTLETLAKLRNMGLHTILGVSNISFGLPKREAINSAFFTMALQNGLSAAIINPLCESMMNACLSFNALSGNDDGCKKYIAGVLPDIKIQAEVSSFSLSEAIAAGLVKDASSAAAELLKETAPLEITNKFIIPALDEAGNKFENKKIFLPQLLMSADAAKAAFEEIKNYFALNPDKSQKKSDKIILATVEGDIHDIGKNIVKVLLENYGFDVIDLGKDVKCEKVLEEVRNSGAKLVGLSALMTTTVPSMAKTISLIHGGTASKVMVGGAVLTAEYSKMIHADYYAHDAMDGVNIAKELFKK